jgi:hypothetical protein
MLSIPHNSFSEGVWKLLVTVCAIISAYVQHVCVRVDVICFSHLQKYHQRYLTLLHSLSNQLLPLNMHH